MINIRRTRAVARKEMLHIFRDPRSLIMALAIPLVMLLLFGYALSLDVDRVPTVVYDGAHLGPDVHRVQRRHDAVGGNLQRPVATLGDDGRHADRRRRGRAGRRGTPPGGRGAAALQQPPRAGAEHQHAEHAHHRPFAHASPAIRRTARSVQQSAVPCRDQPSVGSRSPRSQNSPAMICSASRATGASRCSSAACCEHAG